MGGYGSNLRAGEDYLDVDEDLDLGKDFIDLEDSFGSEYGGCGIDWVYFFRRLVDAREHYAYFTFDGYKDSRGNPSWNGFVGWVSNPNKKTGLRLWIVNDVNDNIVSHGYADSLNKAKKKVVEVAYQKGILKDFLEKASHSRIEKITYNKNGEEEKRVIKDGEWILEE